MGPLYCDEGIVVLLAFKNRVSLVDITEVTQGTLKWHLLQVVPISGTPVSFLS